MQTTPVRVGVLLLTYNIRMCVWLCVRTNGVGMQFDMHGNLVGPKWRCGEPRFRRAGHGRGREMLSAL